MKKISFYFPRWSAWLFILVFLLLGFIYDYHDILFMRPQSMHQWRQCDCLSITMNYYMENLGLFEPEVHCLAGAGHNSGKTVSEFPLIYYSVAKIWKLTGQKEFIFRLINLLIVFIGLLLFFKSIESWLKDTFWALMSVMLVFTSPMLVFYTNNFIADTPALGFALIGWFFFFRFYSGERNTHLWLSALFFLLAGLIKVSSAMSVVALAVVWFLESINIAGFGAGRKIFRRPLLQALPFIIVMALWITWYFWSDHYNRSNGASFFLIGILPVWNLSSGEIAGIIKAVREFWLSQYFQPLTLVVLGLMLIFIWVKARNASKLLVTLGSLLFIGVSAFIVLFFKVLSHHDYYLLNLLILPVFVLFTFFDLLKRNYEKVFSSIIFRIVFILFVAWNIHVCAKNIHTRYYGWLNENHLTYKKAFEDITPYLRSLGIQRTDRVISIPDVSFNITLYLMDQKGWTTFGGNIHDSASIAQKIQLGAKYLMINNPKIYEEGWANSFLGVKVGKWKNVDIYLLSGYRKDM